MSSFSLSCFLAQPKLKSCFLQGVYIFFFFGIVIDLNSEWASDQLHENIFNQLSLAWVSHSHFLGEETQFKTSTNCFCMSFIKVGMKIVNYFYLVPICKSVFIWYLHTFEPSHEIVVLFILRKLLPQTRMRSHPVGLDVWSEFWSDPSTTSILHACERRRLWRDCADAQARLSLRWSLMW